MSNQLTLTNAALPAYLQTSLSAEQVAAMNGAAAAGTGGGAQVNKIGIKAARFRLQPVGGAEITLQQLFLDVAIVRANEGISKVFYAKEWQEGQEAEAPDCSSDDGITPRLDSPKLQHHECATCPMNEWGSKINKHNGKKVKACTDNKRLAIQPPGPDGRFSTKADLYQLSVPPASLTGFGEMIAKLNAMPQKVPYNAVVARMSFDDQSNFPKLKFDAVRFLDNDEYNVVNSRYNEPDTKTVAGLAEVQVLRAPSGQAALGTVQVSHQQQPPVQQPVQTAPAQQPVVQQTSPWPAAATTVPQTATQAPVQTTPWPGAAQAAPAQQPVVQQPQVQAAAPGTTAPQMVQGIGLAFPDGAGGWRAVGKAGGGRTRRTKVEIAQDEAWNNSPAALAAGGPQPVAVTPAAEAVQHAAVATEAPAGWGNPVAETAPVVQQTQAPAGWGETVQQAAPQASAWPAATTALPDANNPFAGVAQAAATGAPNQPGVTTDPVGAFAGWDDPQSV